MAGKPLSDDLKREALEAFNKHGSRNAAARALGLARSTFGCRLDQALKDPPKTEEPEFELPDFPDEDLDIASIIDQQCKRFEKRLASHKAHTWFPVNIKDDKPIGILWFGDPHVDDNGCNWPALRHYCEVAKKTEGLYGANIGDTTNNWVGRLMKKYADQETSVKTARRMAEWIMLDSGVTWLLWLLGNHDTWNDGAEILAQMAKRHGTQKIICHEWEARFRLVFPNGTETKIWAAHDFAGHSMWNPNHGPMKAARFGPDVDLLVCGHKHNWMISHLELADKGTNPLLVRARGFKYMDDYARRLGITEQEEGCAILTVFNPDARTESGRITAFADVDAGADFLTFLRRKHK